MMSAIVLLHRWLGIAFCLLFAMWFATGMVMHFVPFPSLTEAERFAGLAPLDGTRVPIAPQDAVKASGIDDTVRIRLIQRSDGPVYIVAGRSLTTSISATDGSIAEAKSPRVALAETEQHARNRGIDCTNASSIDLADYDQWSVPNGFDRYRPLFHVALGDAAGTEVYVASNTGEIVLDTTRRERSWNFAGSVAHWIYPTVLRRDWALWDRVVWTLSLLAAIASALGAVLGIARIKVSDGRLDLPYRGWHALHHVIGLTSMVFVLTWIVSGWLSMDHGRLFSRGQLSPAEAALVSPSPSWNALSSISWEPISPSAREIEWFPFNGRFYRRDRIAVDRQMLFRPGDTAPNDRSGFLSRSEIEGLAQHLAMGCGIPSVVPATDDYLVLPTIPGAPVYRSICGDVWFDIDGASGMVLQRLDSSRRAYRWLYSALHTMDFPILVSHPSIRTILIISLCSCGLIFSITGIVIGWRRIGTKLTR